MPCLSNPGSSAARSKSHGGEALLCLAGLSLDATAAAPCLKMQAVYCQSYSGPACPAALKTMIYVGDAEPEGLLCKKSCGLSSHAGLR